MVCIFGDPNINKREIKVRAQTAKVPVQDCWVSRTKVDVGRGRRRTPSNCKKMVDCLTRDTEREAVICKVFT